ncbi:MAG: polysaccharide deacetylase family protein [Lachnospiraceae bacterium]|nr:polysaccharide deacetylase family protein [Lachnospiraceae bacterium]
MKADGVSKMNRKIIGMFAAFAALVLIAAAALGGIKWYRARLRAQERAQSGIVLAFDDYSPDNWEQYFDLFDEYDASVTFFVNAAYPTEFCVAARERGHEIGCHTISHAKLTEATEAEVYEQAIAPIEAFREAGFEFTTFAYPYGAYTEELNELLLQHYNVVRGAFKCEPHVKDYMRRGFMESMSLDNVNYESMEQYEARIMEILTVMSEAEGAVVPVYSHTIGDGAWSVSEERLVFLLEKAKEMGLKFYTFQELQK